MSDDPNFFHRSQLQDCWPPRPLSVTGFSFDPATGTFDFSAVPNFDLGRLQSIWHDKTRQYLYARPLPRPLDLAAVDGVTVAAHPASGKVLKVQPSTAGMSADDEFTALYDVPASA